MRLIWKYHRNTLVWSIFILATMFMSTEGLEHSQHPSLDKLIHFGVFSVLSYFAITGIVKQYRFSSRKFQAAKMGWLYAIILGTITETGQYFLGYRTFDWLDLAANASGASVGFLYFQIWISRCIKSGYNLKFNR